MCVYVCMCMYMCKYMCMGYVYVCECIFLMHFYFYGYFAFHMHLTRYGTFFHHEEDYRWPIIRAKMHPIIFWLVFNFSFIASYQVLQCTYSMLLYVDSY
ncbi:hypothetical protein EON63_09190 [archaeon]|nr:MAG: hypothetical protein EON63_09190 [archaeon]